MLLLSSQIYRSKMNILPRLLIVYLFSHCSPHLITDYYINLIISRHSWCCSQWSESRGQCQGHPHWQRKIPLFIHSNSPRSILVTHHMEWPPASRVTIQGECYWSILSKQSCCKWSGRSYPRTRDECWNWHKESWTRFVYWVLSAFGTT